MDGQQHGHHSHHSHHNHHGHQEHHHGSHKHASSTAADPTRCSWEWDRLAVFPSGYEPPQTLLDAATLAGVRNPHKALAECAEAVARAQGALPETLSTEQATAVALYTWHDVDSPRRSPYAIVNEALMTGSGLGAARGLAWWVLTSLRRLPRVHPSPGVYRGIRTRVSTGEYKAGEEVTWGAFSSTSTDVKATEAFVGAKGTFFEALGCWGYDLSDLSLFPSESEVLLEPGTRLRVESVIDRGSVVVVKLRSAPSELLLETAVDLSLGSRGPLDAARMVSELSLNPYASTQCAIAFPTPSAFTDIKGSRAESRVGDEGLALLARSLRTNASLATLRLRDCRVGREGVMRLADGLACNRALRTLDLSGSPVGDTGLACLSGCLRANRTLQSLLLSRCGVGDAGVVGMAKWLEHNKSLRWVDLSGTQSPLPPRTPSLLALIGAAANSGIGSEGVVALVAALRENTSLTSVEVAGCAAGPEVLSRLRSALAPRSQQPAQPTARADASPTQAAAPLEACPGAPVHAGQPMGSIMQYGLCLRPPELSKLFPAGYEPPALLEAARDAGVALPEEALRRAELDAPRALERARQSTAGTIEDREKLRALTARDAAALALCDACAPALRDLVSAATQQSRRGMAWHALAALRKLPRSRAGESELWYVGTAACAESGIASSCLWTAGLLRASRSMEGSGSGASVLYSIEQGWGYDVGALGAGGLGGLVVEPAAQLRVLGRMSKGDVAVVKLRMEPTPCLGMELLCAGLRRNKSVRALSLGGNNNLSDEGIACLAGSLGSLVSLTSLSVAGTNLGPQGAQSLAQCLEGNEAITSLRLSGVTASRACLSGVLEALGRNRRLRDVDLSANGIGDSGGSELFACLRTNKTLTQLALFQNGIGDDAAVELGAALKANSVLGALELRGNQLTKACLPCLIDGLKENTTLTHLGLGLRSDAAPRQLGQISELLVRNKRLLATSKAGQKPC
eukprot:m51a1_g4988 putative nod3 protein (973) ;mRNA; f:89665-94366